MAKINGSFTAMIPSGTGHVKRQAGSPAIPVVRQEQSKPSVDTDRSSEIDFSGASSIPKTPPPLETVFPPAAPNAFATAAAESGLALSDTGSLLVLESPTRNSSAEPPGAPFSTRMPDLKSINISPESVAAQRLTFMNDPSELKSYFKGLMGDKAVHLATAGYSAPPVGYEEPTTKFLTGLAQQLEGNVGFVTSPTADKGSIDAITSTVGQREGSPLGYITADSYLGYVNPENFPADINKQQFASQPKFAFPDADVYSKATAELSNSFLVTGGRNASVNDFKNAVREGNQVLILTNDDVQSPSWDPKKGRVDNASAYLSQMLQGNSEGVPMDNAFNQDMARFIADNKDAINQLVLTVDANNPGATKAAADHLRR